MTPLERTRYNGSVASKWGRWAVTALVALMCLLGIAGAARADDQVDAGQSPVVNVWLDTGRLNVQTWDQPTVSVQTDGQVSVVHKSAEETGVAPHSLQIDAESIQTLYGTVDMQVNRSSCPTSAAATRA